DRQLELAREWHARGGYFETVAGFVFGEQATPDDRTQLEAFVAEHGDTDGGWDVIHELDALGRIGDPRSAPLLVEVAATATYSHARRRALHALTGMLQVPAAVAALHEALWDSEDEAAAEGCSFLPSPNGEARGRIGALAEHALAAAELRLRAARRLRREGATAPSRSH
ncbi:MAG: HEAT repeat domain-containing protein, partial [Planctomycetota bacterium]